MLKMGKIIKIATIAIVLLVLLFVPSIVDDYGLGLMVGILSYVILATAWAMFSGPTGYVSLATVAFFGTGAYVVAVFSETLAYPLIILTAFLVGIVLALIVGLSTLRLSGVYFVVFTLGLAELVRQLVTWYEVNITGELGRYIFLPIETIHIYWQLLALLVVTIGAAAWIRTSRLGMALTIIGDDEVVAQHSGINIAGVKLTLFALSAGIIAVTGAILAPRWVYIEPSIVFNPTVSFMTLIMALLGGAKRLWGPALGAVPLFLMFEWLSADFPNHYPIILGLMFMAIVYLVPNGVIDLISSNFEKLITRNQKPSNAEKDNKNASA